MWIKDLIYWLLSLIFFLILFVIFIIPIALIIISPYEIYFLFTGYILQLFGMILTIVGLLRIRVYFNKPCLKDVFVVRLKQFPFPAWKNKSVEITPETGRIAAHPLTAKTEAWARDDPELSIEERFERLLQNVLRLKEEQSGLQKDITNLNNNFNKHVKQIQNQRKLQEDRLKKFVESAHTNDICISLVGLFLITIGLVLNMIPSITKIMMLI